MRTTFPESIASKLNQALALRFSRESALRLLALAAIVALAAVLRFSNLAALGYVNHYYTAAIVSMLKSWHNFFFVAAEPGGAVSVDKPPLGLWLQAMSAFIFGVNTFSILLPEIIAGILSVIVIYHLVRRSFGTVAGLLAALALAITPVVVAVDRNNTIDSTLILTLLLAAWAFIKATESGKLRFLLLGAALVGIGFNIKMLEAYLPLPAFYALYFLGAKKSVWRKIGNLSLATLLLVVLSLSWVTLVDLIPANERPYVGSSGDNSEMNLAIGYNGVERLLGMFGRRSSLFGGGGPAGGFARPGQGGSGGFPQFTPGQNGGGLFQRGQGGNGGFSRGGGGGNAPFQAAPGGFGVALGGLGSGTGNPGALRLFVPPLSKEVSWLLPLALFSALLLAFRTRLTWPLAPKHQALVLWGVWLLTDMVFFSIAGFFHEYYMAMMAPPLVALVGIGVMELWHLREERPWQATGLFLVAAGATLWLQIATATSFAGTIGWQPFVLGMLGIGALLLATAAIRPTRTSAIAGFSCVVAALLITPGIWSDLTMLNPSENQSLPSAYAGRPSQPVYSGQLEINQSLLDYLEQNTQGMRYLMAVPSSMQGSDYVIATGRPVLYMGGFMGSDQVVTSQDLANLVADGELRYIYWDARGGGVGGQTDISAWVRAQCVAVPNFDTATVNAGAPDGTSTPRSGSGSTARGGMFVTLYDCKQ